jgi:transposase InsO family protein
MEIAMPWRSVTVELNREEFVRLARHEGANVSELCRRFGISRKCGYKWIDRAAGGDAGFADRSRRPLTSPSQTDAAIEGPVLALRDSQSAWGGRKIAHILMRDHGIRVAPSTVTSILQRHGRIPAAASEAAQPWQRFVHEVPNALWQIDFKGHFPVADRRCHPLTVLDDHSRYNIVLEACGDERGDTVVGHLTTAFRRYGLPQRINADNGAPWGNPGHPYLSQVAVWLVRLGIGISFSRPMHPQTNGKEERFHRSLKAEVLSGRAFSGLPDVDAHFRRWRPIYNSYRPHEALGMQTPDQRYRVSTRPFPETLPAIEYSPGDHVRKVQDDGCISFRGQSIRVGTALHGLPVALRLNPDRNAIDIYLCHQRILKLNENLFMNL